MKKCYFIILNLLVLYSNFVFKNYVISCSEVPNPRRLWEYLSQYWFVFLGLASSLFPFAVAPEPLNTPLSTSEGGAGSVENINAGYPVGRPAPGNSGTVSPPITGDRRIHHVSRPTIVSEPMRSSSTDVDSPQHHHQTGRIDDRITSSPGRSSPPQPLPIRAPVIAPVGTEQHAYSQHHSMLLSSLMGNR